MRAIKGHQQTIMVLKVELLGQGVKTPCGTPRSQNELNTRLLRREQFLARTRADDLWSLVSVPSISIAMALIAIYVSLSLNNLV